MSCACARSFWQMKKSKKLDSQTTRPSSSSFVFHSLLFLHHHHLLLSIFLFYLTFTFWFWYMCIKVAINPIPTAFVGLFLHIRCLHWMNRFIYYVVASVASARPAKRKTFGIHSLTEPKEKTNRRWFLILARVVTAHVLYANMRTQWTLHSSSSSHGEDGTSF